MFPTSGQNPPNGNEPEKIYTFDEAILLAKVGSFHYFLQIVCGMCLMTAVVEIMGIGLIIPFIGEDIESTTGQLGFLASAGFIGVVLSSHAVGFLSDTWGRAKMLRSTLSLSFISSFLSAFAGNIWVLIILRFLTGFIMSGCQGSVFNFVGEFHSSKSRAKYVTMLSVFSQIGMIFIPSAGLLILPLELHPVHSWRLLLLLFSFMRTFAVIGLFLLPESPKYDLVQGDAEGALYTLRLIHAKNTGNKEGRYPVKRLVELPKGDNIRNVTGVKDAASLIWRQTSPIFNRDRILQTTNICVTMFLLSAISHGTYMWFPSILKHQVSLSGELMTTCEMMHAPHNESQIGATTRVHHFEVKLDTSMFKILIVIGCIFSVTYFLFSLIIDACGKKKFLFVLILIPGLSSLTIPFITHIPWAIVMLTVLMTLGNCVGIVGTIAFEFYPTKISAMAMSLVLMIARVGSAAGSSFMGGMLHYHCDLLFYLSFTMCMFLLVLTVLLPSKK